MKKNYIQPSIMAREIKLATIMAASQAKIVSGGSNSQAGAPTTAESKFMNFSGDFDDEE